MGSRGGFEALSDCLLGGREQGYKPCSSYGYSGGKQVNKGKKRHGELLTDTKSSERTKKKEGGERESSDWKRWRGH